MGASRHRGERTTAWFDTFEEVRAAEVELERCGIDSMHIRISSADSQIDRRAIDRRSMGWIGRRAAAGAVVGATFGALVGLVVWSLIGGSGEIWYYVVGGLIFGTPPGLFYAVATRLPTQPDAFDTFGDESAGDTWIAVVGPEEVRRDATDVLRRLDPSQIRAA